MTTDSRKVEHTPGPWAVENAGEGLPLVFINAERGFICTIDQPPSPEREANARLIAAAPELLAFLKMFRAHQLSNAEIWQRVTALINKAEGRA